MLKISDDRIRFTDSFVRKLILPVGKTDHIVWDPDLPGFGARLRPGKVSFVVQYRFGTHQRRKGLGDVRKITLEDARSAARKRFAQIELGIDPDAAERDRKADQASDERTFEKVVVLYLEARKPKMRPNTYVAADRYLSRHCAPLHKKPIDRVTREDVASLIRNLIRDHGMTSAARARGALATFFAWCMGEGIAKANPIIGTNNPIEGKKPRSRVLNDDEIRAVWKNCADDDFGKIIRLLMLTACRRDEIGALRWPEINMDTGLMLLPEERTKSKRALGMTLPATAMAVVQSVRRRNSRDTLFGGGPNGFNAWSYNTLALNGRIAAAEGKALAPWRIHDLRRTVRTRLSKLGVLPHIAELVLNHAGHRSGVDGKVYDWHDYEPEISEALRKWEARLLAIISAGPDRSGA